ncbi:MAG TPA: ABC transporter substrate-binding protein [Beijerinckiaceae bacterium]|jgi:putative ABC transport system substrate-binding protein
MRRREVIVGLGAAALPAAVRAQTRAVPVVGFLTSGTLEAYSGLIAAFRDGLSEAGYVDGRDVAIEARGADGRFETTAGLAAGLVARGAAVIVATGNGSALAAKSAAGATPLVVLSQGDPVAFGLAASLSRPGGNVTGVSLLAVDLLGKRLEIARQIVPDASAIAVLFNPKSAEADAQQHELKEAARRLSHPIRFLDAGTPGEIEAAFAEVARLRPGALIVSTDAFLFSRRDRIVDLAARVGVPAIYDRREFAAEGGLLSYGADYAHAFRRLGVYTGKVLKGASPAELPIEQSAKVELIINLKTARSLGLTLPLPLLGRADEVIE